ncbi:MAG: SDR family oxidoreductase [Candidatus Methylacidiphilales bacterium]|nr:SDR family NAD(P)-dependent oxidoreductase [Candidatus Methylacidiphilales bacterium]
MTVLVTGGTGFVGREIVKKLHEKGYKIRMLVRKPEDAWQMQRRYNTELVQGDVTKPDTLPAAVKGVQAIIHLVGIIRETSAQVTFQKVHAEGTANLAKAALDAGVKRFVLMSAAGTRPGANSTYHQSKFEAEQTMWKSGLDFTIFRPSIIYGPNDQSINTLARVMRFPFDLLNVYAYPNLGGGETYVQPIHVDEVAHCFVDCLGNAETNKKIYFLCGPKPVHAKEMLAIVATALGKAYTFESTPVLTIARSILWAFVAAIPLAVVLFSTNNILSELWPFLLGLSVIWGILLVAAIRWRSLIFYHVPLGGFSVITNVVNPLLPRYLQFGEQLKMLQEDNIGDPEPASKMFRFDPKPFGPDALTHVVR